MNEDYDNNPQNIVGIKAESSIFRDRDCFSTVADMIASLVQPERQIYFVVSAVKGETNRTIASIAEQEAYGAADSFVDHSLYSSLHKEMSDALTGNPREYRGIFNTSRVAEKLVQPEMSSVEHLVHALTEKKIDAIGLQHGSRYPLIGVDNRNYLYATPDLKASARIKPKYNAQVVVVPGFGVRNVHGEVMCTGRGSSDLTLAQFGTIFELDEIVFWKDTQGYLRDSADPAKGIYETISREQVEAEDAKVLERRVLRTYAPPIRITGKGQLTGGTLILPYENAHVQEAVQNLAAK